MPLAPLRSVGLSEALSILAERGLPLEHTVRDLFLLRHEVHQRSCTYVSALERSEQVLPLSVLLEHRAASCCISSIWSYSLPPGLPFSAAHLQYAGQLVLAGEVANGLSFPGDLDSALSVLLAESHRLQVRTFIRRNSGAGELLPDALVLLQREVMEDPAWDAYVAAARSLALGQVVEVVERLEAAVEGSRRFLLDPAPLSSWGLRTNVYRSIPAELPRRRDPLVRASMMGYVQERDRVLAAPLRLLHAWSALDAEFFAESTWARFSFEGSPARADVLRTLISDDPDVVLDFDLEPLARAVEQL